MCNDESQVHEHISPVDNGTHIVEHDHPMGDAPHNHFYCPVEDSECGHQVDNTCTNGECPFTDGE